MPTLSYRQVDSLDNIIGTINISDYSGGLNTTASNEELKDNEAIIRKNWGNSSLGAIEKVNGYTKTNSATMGAKPIRGLFRVYQSGGTKHLLAMCNGKLYYSTNNGTTFTQESGSVAFTETVFNTGVNYNNLFFFTNPTDNLYHYTPGTTTAAAATNTPTDPCKVLLKRSDRRLLALVNTVNGSTLYFSKIDPTGIAADDWSAANDAGSIAIDGALSEPLTGGMTFAAVDIIFKDYAAFKVWGYPAPVAVRIPGSPGCAAPYSVAQGDGLGFHLAHDGVYMYDGNKFIDISDPINDIIDSINPSYVQNSFGIYRDGYYWLFYTASGNTTNQNCIIYDVFHSNPYEGRNVWFERDNLLMNCPVVFNGTGDDNEIYAGDSASTGFVYRLDYSSTGADNTSNIEAEYQTKYFNAKLPRLVKRFSKIMVRYYLAKGSLLVYWYTNRGLTSGSFTISLSQTGAALGSFVLGTDVLSSDVEATHIERLPETAIGKDISLKFYHNNTGKAPIIRECEIEWEGLYLE
jgi:hypothetical protein